MVLLNNISKVGQKTVQGKIKKRHLIYFKMAANEKIGPIPLL